MQLEDSKALPVRFSDQQKLVTSLYNVSQYKGNTALEACDTSSNVSVYFLIVAAIMAPECHRQWDLASATSGFYFWLKSIQSQGSNFKRMFIWKVRGRKSEPDGRGLREQAAEAKEGALELRKGKGKGNMPGDGVGGRKAGERCVGFWEGEPHGVLHFEGIYLEVSEEDDNRIFISCPGVSFQDSSLC